jgi:mannose-1-phosphate guanylyltransferase/mannose-6-phosphate isomerase
MSHGQEALERGADAHASTGRALESKTQPPLGIHRLPSPPVFPVFLSGGGGSRLWPLSQGERPKQFLRLAGDLTLFQQAVLRTADRRVFRPPFVVGGARHGEMIAEQLQTIGQQASLVLEPFGRDTAPAVTAALLECVDRDEDALAFVLPTDHVVGDPQAFAAAATAAARLAATGAIVLFGLTPTEPATGFGYIRRGASLASEPGAHKVATFEEKPDAPRAAQLIAEGCLWNSGMFMLPAKIMLDLILDRAPEVFAAAEQAWAHGRREGQALYLNAEAFGHAPAISIDRAVIEKTDRAVVLAADLGWADLGTWSALWDAGERDATGSVLSGSVVAKDVANVLVRAEGLTVAAIGVEDLIIVATPDGVLVSRRGRDAEIKDLAPEIARLSNTRSKP